MKTTSSLLSRSYQKLQITPEATHILAGGLGGICREISRWLSEKGAKHLVSLSRSAATGNANLAFTKNLHETYGVNAIAFDCDVADQASLKCALDEGKEQGLPPVRRCVTGAIVLRVCVFLFFLLYTLSNIDSDACRIPFLTA